MKIAIVYYSSHHGNTKRLLDAVCAENHDIVLINAAASPITELSDYDLIGFASGIYYSKFHDTVLRFAEQTLKKGQKVFFLYYLRHEESPLYSGHTVCRREKRCGYCRKLWLPWVRYLRPMETDWRYCKGTSRSI